MVTIDAPMLRVVLPTGWFVAGLGTAQDLLTWGLLDGVVDQPRRERLTADALRVLGMGRPAGSRAVAAAHPDPAVRDRVIAAGTVSLGLAADFDGLSHEVDSTPVDPSVIAHQVDVWGRRSAAVWVRHELLTSTSGVLHERCVVVRNVADLSATLVLSTSDLESFTDIAATCARMVRSLKPASGTVA